MSDSQQSSQKTISIESFVERKGEYYRREFKRVHSTNDFVISFNPFAAVFGPLWGATRNVWSFFWLSTLSLLIALVLLGQGLWGQPGADKIAQAERLLSKSQEMIERAEVALENGTGNVDALQGNAENLQRASDRAMAEAEAAASSTQKLSFFGALLLFLIVLAQGFFANMIYERNYCQWRADPEKRGGFSYQSLALGVMIILVMFPMTIYRFTAAKPVEWLVELPTQKWIFNTTSNWLDGCFDFIADKGAAFFQGITNIIRSFLDIIEIALVGTPWPVIIFAILFMSWRISGVRAALCTATALSYLALFGYWEKSMSTIALLGAAALICVVIGVPLGILCAKNKTIDSLTKPVLDFMQTMPAFVYLIPIIAFFGTGKPPGVLATIIFGMPPVVRLTTLGIQQVPDSIVEGALAFGCSRRKLLMDVEIPLAKSSILAGINQTILMCLSMVVIASLIGAEGLGTDVLQALQFAAKGQGLLAGLAILFCAIMIDRIIQGYFKPGNKSGNND
jgi:glycine betaine/proline transport system permease protein